MPLLGLRFLSCYYAKVVKIMISQARMTQILVQITHPFSLPFDPKTEVVL